MSIANRLRFDETLSGKLALLATEATRNVLVHGGGGQVVLSGVKEENVRLARILAIDKGNGIANIADAMADGFSTAGTMGGGLGAMKRMATNLDIFTGRTGTVVMIELLEPIPKETRTNGRMHVAGFAVPYPGERVCGDAWFSHQTPHRTVILLADGLGHGWGASEAAAEAVATFRQRADLSPGEILGYIHDALRKTRGAVAAIAEIRPAEGALIYAGVGNVAGVVLENGASRSLVSHNGTLGMMSPKIQEFRSAWSPASTLVLHSDGLQSRWDLSSYAGLIARHPAVIGGALLRDFRRQRDDVSVVVTKAA
ncbi:SpoIIE family protein phosphatase [Telmatobacter sp. DSM 110680]|uniref:SpoIIE family protein phosphatase n=1 Tax=Telmatobacter sp. DSM 110680 TaxID=3036704 RepID=A0AAU7DGW0_9BACT